MARNRADWPTNAYGLGSIAALGVATYMAVRALPDSTIGGIDPLSAIIALVSLALTLWSGLLALKAAREQELDILAATQRSLAVEVLAAESRARTQLLGDHGKPIDVQFSLIAAPSHNAETAARLGHLSGVVAYYKRLLPRRLLITGSPGSGKTVLAVELLMALLESRRPSDPVPVRLPLASWDTDKPLEQWIASHLIETYRISASIAEALVTAGAILPVLDGLDEMDSSSKPGYSSRAGRALRAMNRYQIRRSKADLVVTCRTPTYDALQEIDLRAEDAARIEIHPVDAPRAEKYILARVANQERWAALLHSLRKREPAVLADGLSTPWRLTLALTVYEERDSTTGAYLRSPDELLDLGAQSDQALSEHLFRLLPQAALSATPPPNKRYQAERVEAWLAELAKFLNANASEGRSVGGRTLSGSDIVPHELWPIAGTRGPRLVSSGFVAVIWITGATVMLTHTEIGYTLPKMFGAGAMIFGAAASIYSPWAIYWPEIRRAEPRRLATRTGVAKVLAGTIIGACLSALVALFVEWVLGGLSTFQASIIAGVGGGAIMGATRAMEKVGLAVTPDPREAVRKDLILGLTTWPLAGIVLGTALASFSGIGWTFALALGLAGGFAAGLCGGFAGGLAGSRYIAMLLISRGRIPWRLGAFLDWCYRAGLMRVVGIGYQFRHRELQDYLADMSGTNGQG